MTPDWQPRLAELVRMLVSSGSLRSAEWIDAFSAIPRHVFTPEVIVRDADEYRTLCGNRAEERDAWLSLVYSDESLVVQDEPHAAGYTLPSGARLRVPTSSSTMPSLMARMLEVLDVQDGMRILEIGTGTGYNAALLAHRVGDSGVVSVDIDADLVGRAAARLADIGRAPTLLTGDGALGAAAYGPYDRIIATAAVPKIPLPWIRQLAPGGKLLVNLRGDLAGASLCLLTKIGTDDELIGPLLPLGGHFMWLRSEEADSHPAGEQPTKEQRRPTGRTMTWLDPAAIPVDDDAFRHLLQLQLPGVDMLYRGQVFDPGVREQRPAVVVGAGDGSRAELFAEQEPGGGHRVVHCGPRRIVDTVAATCRLFEELGRPEIGRFGVVANDGTQFVWFGDDDNWYRWPLPLR